MSSKVYSSFATVSEQIINYNNNVLQLFNQLNNLATSNSSSITVQVADQFGVLKEYNIPSIGYLLSEIQRLNNNLNSLYSLNNNGAIIQSATNKYKKIITVDLNREPASLTALNPVTRFKSTKNWFFDGLLNPMLSVQIDLTNKVEDNVRKILSRRYIVEFEQNADETFTPTGQSALNSFNNQFRGKSNINLDDFVFWLNTTPGIMNGTNPNYDEQVFDLEPNELLYDGTFTVLKTEEDRLNRKFWYHLDTLNYFIAKTGEVRQLTIDDEVIINLPESNSRFKVVEISTISSNFRVRFEQIEGNQPIPVANSILKIYSQVIFNKNVKVSIGFNERNVLFVKPMNADNHLVARNWSLGVGYWTNDLILDSSDSDNGTSMEKYYADVVYDYGTVLTDLVAKKIPNKNGLTPNPVVLSNDNFKVVQINKHLTDTADADLIKSKHNQQKNIKSEISQITEAINSKQKQAKILKFPSVAAKNQFDNELNELIKKKDSKSNLLSSTVQDILNLSQTNLVSADPKFRLRGFWIFPEAAVARGTKPQEVIQFRIQYRYLSKDGQENQVDSIKVVNTDGKVSANGALSNWIELKSDVRQRGIDPATNAYIWKVEDVSDIDTPNINQLDIPIQQGERVEVRVKSISEVGWPESPVESDWSNIMSFEFPDNLNNVLGDNQFILKEASQEDLRVKMESDLNSRGLGDILNNVVTINNKTYTASAENVLSGFKDVNGLTIDLYSMLVQMNDKIKALEEKIKRAKGQLKVTVLRNNDEFIIQNNTELEFTVECEDYLETFTGAGIPTGRVYSNDIYVVKDFVLRVENVAVESPLGLLSNRTYYVNSELFNTAAPQIFWANERDELLFSQATGSTRTQLNNQFLWSINYEVTNQTAVTKLADNIGNSFAANGNNSIVNVLSSTEFNVGYSDTSLLGFIGSNNSLLDIAKWTDTVLSVSSNTKLLTTIHPVIATLEKIVQTNNDKVQTVNAGSSNAIIIPINIYFKMNSIDPNSGTGLNYGYINLNNSQNTIKHIKKVKFMLENEDDNRPFIFTVKFNINRNKLVIQKLTPNTKTTISSKV